MMKQALIVIEAKEQRAYQRTLGGVAESADDAIRGAQPFDFEPAAFAHDVGLIEPFRDDAVERTCRAIEPSLRGGSLARVRGEAEQRLFPERREKRFQHPAPLRERTIDERLHA